MTKGASEVIRQLRRAAFLVESAGATDGQLLAAFIDGHDSAALELLVQRHGPMVWGVCHRLLPGQHDAEDAFQATFLVLVRRAASVAPREMVANWLYGVARQTARKARALAARRRTREAQFARMPEFAAAEKQPPDDLRRLLDEELSRLPADYRAAIVLCDLEGLTRKDAAGRLGLPEGTVASRVARGRAILARRLARRGLALAGAAALSEGLAPACPPALLSTVVKVACPVAGYAAPVSAEVTALVEGVMKSMLLSKLKGLVVVLALASALTLAWGWQAHSQTPPQDQAARKPDLEEPQQGKDSEQGKEAPAPQEPRPRASIETPGGSVKSLAFSPDGKALTSLANEGPIWAARTWDPVTGKGHLLLEYGHELYSLVYSPDGKTMAWGCKDRALKVWDVAAGKEKANLVDRSVTSVAFSPDGKELASAHEDGTVRARDLATNKEWILQQHSSRAFSLTYSADGKALAWGCNDKSLRVWDLAAGKEKANFKDQNVSLVRFSPDGKALAASGNWGTSVRLLDVETGKELATFKLEKDLVTCLAFSPDGKVLAAGGNKGSVLLWDVASGQETAALKGHPSGVSALAFSPDGRTLATGGPDKEIRLWDLPGR